MQLTTRSKITLLFSAIVTLIIISLNALIIHSANREWTQLMNTNMALSLRDDHTLEELQSRFRNLEAISDSGSVISQQGLFQKSLRHTPVNSFFFDTTYLTRADDGRYYYWGIMPRWDGLTYKVIEDVTEIIAVRDMTVRNGFLLSFFGLILTLGLGYFFSGYILRPIKNMNAAAQIFSLSDRPNEQISVGIYGNIKDEVVVLARTLEDLFVRVNAEATRLEQFSDDIAHELKNRLFEIASSLDVALATTDPKIPIQKAKSIIKQLSNVVDALLFFARNEVGEPEKLSLGVTLKEGLHIEDPRLEVLGSDDIMLPIHRELFLTALGNIISNALKFTKPEGKVTVTLEKDSLRVQDTGIGISQKDLPHIFDRFYMVDQVRTSGKGSGLGLSLAKKILEDLHGFHLSVESELGVGTTCTLTWKAS